MDRPLLPGGAVFIGWGVTDSFPQGEGDEPSAVRGNRMARRRRLVV